MPYAEDYLPSSSGSPRRRRRRPAPAPSPSTVTSIAPPASPPRAELASTGLSPENYIANPIPFTTDVAMFQERQEDRGVARERYRNVLEALAPLLPQIQVQRPKLRFQNVAPDATASVAHANPNVIHGSQQLVDLLSGRPVDRRLGKQILIHELAHTQQPLTQRPSAMLEGGAEAFAARAAQQLWGSHEPPPPSYVPHVRDFRRAFDRRYLMEGQFR